MASDGELPSGYKKGITRVSELVSFIHPFKWTNWEQRYKSWLANNWIDENKYLKWAQTMWTYVHEALEQYILKGKIKRISKSFSDCKKEIEHWIDWIKNLNPEEIETEKYVREKSERFQGSVDLLYKKDGKYILADWKTYWIVKKRFNLNNKFTIPTSKRQKVQLQMSIYCYALKQAWIIVDKIELLFLHEEWIKVVEFEPLPDEQIEELLNSFEKAEELKNKIIIPNYINMAIRAPLKIHLQTAPQPYQNISIELDLTQLENWQTPEEAVNEAVRVQKQLHNDYIKISWDWTYLVNKESGVQE